MKRTVPTDAIVLNCWLLRDELLQHLDPEPALMPLGDKPMLQRVVERLVDLGCRRITVVHGDRPQQAQQLLGDGERWGCQITHKYAGDGARPLAAIATSLANETENCFLASAETVISAELARQTPCAVYSGAATSPTWTGWAVLTPTLVRSLAEQIADAQDLHRTIDDWSTEGKLSRVLGNVLSTVSAAAIIDSLPRLFELSPGMRGISRRTPTPGIWIGKGSRIHPSVRLQAPLYVGNNVLVSADARLGPNATIGDGCVVDTGCQIEDSVVLPGTYIGRKLDVRDALLVGNTLVNTRLGVAVRLADPEFVSSVEVGSFRLPRPSLTQRALAAALWACLVPLRWTRAGRDASRTATAGTIGVPSPIPGRYGSLAVRFKTAQAGTRKWAAGMWRRHFFETFLPGLADVASGKVALVGLQPRSPEELSSLPYYWQRLYQMAPTGLLDESLLCPAEDPSPEMSYAGAALCAGRLPLGQLADMLRRYAAGLFADRFPAASERIADPTVQSAPHSTF